MSRLAILMIAWLVAAGARAQAPDLSTSAQQQAAASALPAASAAPPPPVALTLDQYERQLRWQLAVLAQREDDIRAAGHYTRRRFRIVGGFVGGGLALVGGWLSMAALSLATDPHAGTSVGDDDAVPTRGGAVVGLLFAGALAGFTVAFYTLAHPAPYIDALLATRRAYSDGVRELRRVTQLRRQQPQLSFGGSGLRVRF